jgi:hypothetical protein
LKEQTINAMTRILFIASLISIAFTTGSLAQSNQSPTMQQSTSTEDNRLANPVKPKVKKTTKRARMEMEQGLDTTLPKNRKQRRLRPDSLRRGGATRVDTVRR